MICIVLSVDRCWIGNKIRILRGDNVINYVEVPREYDFSTEFSTWIIAFCPDSNGWFVTNKRFFFYEYNKEFETEEEGIKFFKNNPKIFYDEEIRMEIYKPSFYKNGVWLDNTREFIKI